MIACSTFYQTLQQQGVGFFAGVPDSLLKDICAYITDQAGPGNHLITANEGAAVAVATGFHLATGGLGLVYLQNSGLGNLINPLTSLTDPEVYSIPMLLLVGWRGEPGVPDEPQHRKQGRITPRTLEALEIPFAVLPSQEAEAVAVLATAVKTARERNCPYALLVQKGTFEPYQFQGKTPDRYAIQRETALKLILNSLTNNEVVVSTTGMTSREVFEHREATQAGHARDFLTVGCMGHASQIALGIAAQKPDRQVYCLDGDGAVIMHLGGLAIVGAAQLANYKHVVVNNGAHDSVGGQPTVGFDIDLPTIAKACGYRWAESSAMVAEIPALLEQLRQTAGPALLEIRVNKGSRKDLGRPTTTPLENKRDFMAWLQAAAR
jgi:phosphonopyruvate decarboxylase